VRRPYTASQLVIEYYQRAKESQGSAAFTSRAGPPVGRPALSKEQDPYRTAMAHRCSRNS